MSSTRHATGDGPLRQERFASSPEFERGLIASMVARRCSVLDAGTDRELIWALQFLSHRDGGLRAVSSDLQDQFRERIGTKAMVKIGKRAGNYNADQVRAIRGDLPDEYRSRYPVRGDRLSDFNRRAASAEYARRLERCRRGESDLESPDSEKHPASYPAAVFQELCSRAALVLEDELRNLCLAPVYGLSSGPWYFADLSVVLRDYVAKWIAGRASAVVTELGSKVHETLAYTLHSRKMSLVEGIARMGKSFSARSWCEQHPGATRFIEVPTGNDETSFLRDLARGIGLGNFQQYKAGEIKERVESVLRTGDLLLCLDEAQRLLPSVNFRYGYPKRIEWLLSMVNAGVPVCLISQPGFVQRLKVLSENTGWNPAQFIGRLAHREDLPPDLSIEDLTAVAREVLPEADKPTLRALAAHARTSSRYLAAIETVTSRAKYIAGREGRTETTADDVRRAMKESIASDSKVVAALGTVTKPRRQKFHAATLLVTETGDDSSAPVPARGITPANSTGNRMTKVAPLVTAI